ncbi:MAG: DUF488 family protein [Candidatus Levybacteria bacterium]|nr:DUF488 family protein [Candidatus Levybacteria bacterium]MBI2622719.1 DUF488 family protein [Candidatus Levybacteria bacterium]
MTKSIQAKTNKQDGIRICIMRRIKPEFEFDIWMPALAPSTRLLKTYHEGKIEWKEYEKRFIKTVLSKQKKYLKIILDILKKNSVTLLCWEETPERCHRRLTAERLKKLNHRISLILK